MERERTGDSGRDDKSGGGGAGGLETDLAIYSYTLLTKLRLDV